MKTPSKTWIVIALVLAFNALAAVYFTATGWGPRNKTAKKASPAVVSQASKPSYRKAVIQGAIRAKTTELEGCYNAYLADSPEVAEGSIRIGWDIGPEGAVTAVRVIDTDLADDDFTSCVTRLVQSWEFTPSPDGEPLVVAHKFSFHQRSPASLEFE